MIKLSTHSNHFKSSTPTCINPQEISSIEEYSFPCDTGKSRIIMHNKTSYVVEETMSEIYELIELVRGK